MPPLKTRNTVQRRAEFPEEPSRAGKAVRGRTTATETPTTIRGIGVRLNQAERAYIRQRLGFKLGKFALRVRRVAVQLSEEKGVSGVPRCECRVTVRLDRAPDIFVEVRAAGTRPAFDTAIDRAERAARRSLQRSGGRK